MRALAAIVLLLIATPATAVAQQAPAEPGFAERLPRHWCGLFRWEGEALEQVVRIAFTRAAFRADGRFELNGDGRVRYRHEPHGETVPFRMRAIVEPATRRIEMFEALDAPRPDYVTDGSHVGELAPDLQSMRLVWTTRSTGRRGALELYSRPPAAELAQECGVPSS